MFTKKDIGRKIRIKNTNGANWVEVGREYAISDVPGPTTLRLSGVLNPWGATNSCFEFVDNKPVELKVGDRVIVHKKTTSLEEGEEYEITGFMCDNPARVITTNMMPGGWIDSQFISKVVDIGSLRVLKAIELWKDYTSNFLDRFAIGLITQSIIGKTLTELRAQPMKNKVDFRVKNSELNYILTGKIVSDKPYSPITMVFPDGGELITRDIAVNTRLRVSTLAELLAHVGINVVGRPEDDDALILDFNRSIIRRGTIELSDTISFVPYAIEFKNQNKDEKQLEETLPF